MLNFGKLSKYNGVKHCAKAFHDILIHGVLDIANKMFLGIHFTYTSDIEIFELLFILFLNPLVVIGCEFLEFLHNFDSATLLLFVVLPLEWSCPILPVQILEHSLFNFTLSVVNCYRIIVLVETSSQGEQTGLLQVTNIRCSLSGFQTLHYHGRLDWSECINNNFTFDRLNWINNYSDCSLIHHFLRFLCLHISSRKPASKTRVRVIPSNAYLISANLLHHFHEFLLINWIYCLRRNGCTDLRHRKHIYDTNCVIIMNLTNHESHYFERDTCSRVFQHF